MRLRLSVQRHGLPPTNILWTIPDNQSPQAYTIARLLEDVNRIIPLEAEHWGLEDYVVELGGFECLHFSPVAQVLKDEDQVSIRSLITADVRARTLSGRLQISEGGQHLVDGIPFGRPYLREPNRPPIRIPPLKRRRLLEENATEDEEHEVAGLLTEHGHVSSSEQGSDKLTSEDLSPAHERARPKSSGKAVRFQDPPGDVASDSEEDEDFDLDADLDSSSVSSSSAASSDTSSSESSEDDSDEGPEEIVGNGTSKSTTRGVDGSSEDSESTSEDSDSDSDTSSNENETATSASTRKQTRHKRGKKVTQSRNARRKDVALLKRTLQPLGLAPAEATLVEVRKFREQPENERQKQIDDARTMLGYPAPTRSKKRKRKASKQAPSETGFSNLDLGHVDATPLHAEPEVNAGNDSTQEATRIDTNSTAKGVSVDERQQLEARRAALLAQLDSGGVDVTLPSTNGSSMLDVSLTTAGPTQGPATPPLKRPRLDLGAAGRMIKAGIPLQKKRKAETKPEPKPQLPPEPTDPDAWTTKINYSAYECWYEEFDELRAPPFPFKQHWDKESCDAMKEKYTAKKNKQKSKAKTPTDEEAFNHSKDVIMLDYGDGGTGKKEEKGRNVDDIIQSQLQKDVDTENIPHADGPSTPAKPSVPPLPEDPDFYPPLSLDDVKVGMVVLFQHFAINPKDKTPEISPLKTAVVEAVEDDGMLALRMKDEDIGGLEKDDDGNVWFEKGELLEAKLLKDVAVEVEAAAT